MKLTCTALLALFVATPATAFAPATTFTGYSTSETALNLERNKNFSKLAGGYLFPEIGRRRNQFIENNPEKAGRIISLGIGDTTQPIPEHILKGLTEGVTKLGKKETYSGYGAEQGNNELRAKISEVLYKGLISPSSIFVSDGAKCDIARLQTMFGSDVKVAVQDPSYPVYVDTAVMMGQTGNLNQDTKQYDGIKYLECKAENNFFIDLDTLADDLNGIDVVFLCFPNNPTGCCANKTQLSQLIDICKTTNTILVYDAAYAPFIQSDDIPQSIYEIEGADEIAIEVNSFSKYAGFTGVRLGWTVVPEKLKFADGSLIQTDFNRLMTTGFNGASNIVQNGGLACLDEQGLAEWRALIQYYMENAKILKETFTGMGYSVYGGEHAPYIFVDLKGESSWDTFSTFLEKVQVVTIPGAGFGPGGEGFIRLSAFAPRENIEEACRRFKEEL